VDDLFAILIFLLFILAPLIEQIRRRGKTPPPPPPPRRPVQRPSVRARQRPSGALPQTPQPSQSARSSRTEEVSSRPATVLLPDDLWQVLTGQKPLPREEPSYESSYDAPPRARPRDEEDVEAEGRSLERVGEEARSLEVSPAREEPVIVSLEEEETPAAIEARHAAFHKRVLTSDTYMVRERAPRVLLPLGTRDELQRAVLLQQILGRPKGLE
jgi:hypothetical protein